MLLIYFYWKSQALLENLQQTMNWFFIQNDFLDWLPVVIILEHYLLIQPFIEHDNGYNQSFRFYQIT